MRTFAVILLAAGSVPALPLPENGVRPPFAVDPSAVRAVALRKAAAEYPGARLGVELPYVDQTGATVAYSFVFRVDGGEMGGYDDVRADILAERAQLGPDVDLTRWRSKYAHVTVSARRDRRPILRYGYGAGEYWAVGAVARERARLALGSEVRFTRLYFIHPVVYFEFEDAAGRRVIYSEHFERSWDSREAFVAEVEQNIAEMRARHGFDASAAAAVHFAEWETALAADFRDYTEVFVPSVGRAPFYDWSYGCTPTSGAMVLGYIDRTQDYGKLIKWFAQRYDMVEGEPDWQIPNAQRECAIAMGTDTTRGGTSIYGIAGGLQSVGMANGYVFTMLDALGASWNDWCWDTIKMEIDAGRAHVWSALWAIHSLAAFGYREPQKDVYVHNTWWAPAEWWGHSGNDFAHVASPDPWGGDPRRVELVYPKGDTNYNSNGRGQQFYVGDTVRVVWANFGPSGSRVGIDLSLNGGKDWTVLDDNVPDTGAWNWVVSTELRRNDSTRLRLRQYSGTAMTSADGSFGNFLILREPLPPPQVAPPNGLPVFDPPVVVEVDSSRARADSFDFKLILGTDTLLRHTGTSPRWSLDGYPFIYGRIYKWVVRGRNNYGWSEWSAPWSFRILFQGIEETVGRPVSGSAALPVTIARLSAGQLEFGSRKPNPSGVVTIFDAAGRVVVSISPSRSDGTLSWNMCDNSGKIVGPGCYIAVLEPGRVMCKLVLMR